MRMLAHIIKAYGVISAIGAIAIVIGQVSGVIHWLPTDRFTLVTMASLQMLISLSSIYSATVYLKGEDIGEKLVPASFASALLYSAMLQHWLSSGIAN